MACIPRMSIAKIFALLLGLFSLILVFVLSPMAWHLKYRASTSSTGLDSSILDSEGRRVYVNPVIETSEKNRKDFSFARHGPPLPLYAYSAKRSDVASVFGQGDLFGRSRRQTPDANCHKLVYGDKEEFLKWNRSSTTNERKLMQPQDLTKLCENCESFRQARGYITDPLTVEEQNFPIAFSIVAYTDAGQTERLLRAIYRPQNAYCIHVDAKATPGFRRSMEAVAGCFDNVIVAKRSVGVVWGTYSVLETELICMEELWTLKRWKYFINLTGQEFPLRTNLELVRILTAYNGSNDIEGSKNRTLPERYAEAGSPPGGIIPIKGGVHIVASRDFVDYILHSPVAVEFLNWTKKVYIPDEIFFSSLNHNPQLGIKGTYRGKPETDGDRKPFLARFKNWGGDWRCHGKYVHDICVFGAGDLPLLSTREELFANKFFSEFESITLDCLEELLLNRTIEEYYGTLVFNTSYYETRDFVKNKVI